MLGFVQFVFSVGLVPVGNSICYPLSGFLGCESVVDRGFDVDMPERRVNVAVASCKRGPAFCTPKDRDQVCFLAGVAKDFCNGTGVGLSMNVWFIGPVVDIHAWWFQSDLERDCLIGGGGRSSESVAVELAFGKCRRRRGRGGFGS